MGSSYPRFSRAWQREQLERQAAQRRAEDEETAVRDKERSRMAGQVVMAVVDKIIADIVRPGPKPEERECYQMAGEVREIVPELEALVLDIINVNDGVK